MGPSIINGDRSGRCGMVAHVTAGVMEVTLLQTTTAAADEAGDTDDSDDDTACCHGDSRHDAQLHYALGQRIVHYKKTENSQITSSVSTMDFYYQVQDAYMCIIIVLLKRNKSQCTGAIHLSVNKHT